MRACIISLVTLLFPDAALACGKTELRVLIEAAQALSERTEQLGTSLLVCPGETVEAAQWLAFYRSLQARPAPATERTIAPQLSARGSVGNDIAAAYRGRYAPLRAKLDAGDPLYRETPEASLAVARMLVRERRFSEGRHYYEDFLRLRDSAPEAVEYLYTFIWEGDLERADQELNSARGDAYLTAAAQRGRRLVQQLRSRRPSASPQTRRTDGKPLITAGADSFFIKDQLRRHGSLVHYQDIVDASWRHYILAEQVYDEPTLNTDELRLGREHTFGERVTLAAQALYVVHAKRHWGGSASARFLAPGAIHLALGVERRFLYRDTPMPKAALGLTQDEQWLAVGWDERITLKSAVLQDRDAQPFERHSLNLRQPLGSGITARGLLDYENRTVPSPNYETFRKTQRLGVGAIFQRPLDSRWSVKAEALYSLHVRQAFGDERYLRHSGVDLHAELTSHLFDQLRALGQITYSALETSRPSGNVEQRLALLAALQLLH